MPCDLWRAVFKTVELHPSIASAWIVEGAIAPTRQAIFSPPDIAEAFHHLLVYIQSRNAANDGYQVQNGLGANAGNCSRSDMMTTRIASPMAAFRRSLSCRP